MIKHVILDAGHGGSDPGASGNGIVEKDLTLKINNYIHNRLDALGIDNTVTRVDDVTLDPTTRTKTILNKYGNGKDTLLVSNHINAGGGEGAEIIYALRNNDTFSKLINKNLEDIGRDVRKYYQRRLPSNPSKDYYFILRDTPDIEAVIVEYGFLDNQKDANLLKNNYEDYAEAIVKSIAEYLGVKYVAPTNLNGDYYIVEKGDTLYNIAKKFNTTVDNLKLMNNLKSNLLSIGQKLIIKNNNNQTNDMDNMTYQVVKGDTLYQLAKRFNTTVDELKRLNNLTSNTLSIGQVLKLPSKYYIVKKGDTLYSISKANNTTVNNIIEKNGLKSTTLSIGQQLIL